VTAIVVMISLLYSNIKQILRGSDASSPKPADPSESNMLSASANSRFSKISADEEDSSHSSVDSDRGSVIEEQRAGPLFSGLRNRGNNTPADEEQPLELRAIENQCITAEN
jgi:hypothetical protein